MFAVSLGFEKNPTLMNEWAYVLSSFRVHDFVCRGGPMRRAKDEVPDFPVVLIAPSYARYVPGDISLLDFEHPDECVYYFGGTHEMLHEAPEGTVAKVYIPTIDGFHAPMCGPIVFYDRMIKRGGLG